MSPSFLGQYTFTSSSPEKTQRLGERLGALLAVGDLICLSGNLGAGKTALTRGIAAGWGAREAVTSPTFTLIHEHHRPADGVTLYHVDCYRLGGPDDAWGIGLEDLLHNSSIVVIEWPEKIAALLPANRLWITLDLTGDTTRQITLDAGGARSAGLLSALAHELENE